MLGSLTLGLLQQLISTFNQRQPPAAEQQLFELACHPSTWCSSHCDPRFLRKSSLTHLPDLTRECVLNLTLSQLTVPCIQFYIQKPLPGLNLSKCIWDSDPRGRLGAVKGFRMETAWWWNMQESSEVSFTHSERWAAEKVSVVSLLSEESRNSN